MRKRDELADPKSCMNRARDDEWTFVLLGRDLAAPAAVRAWIQERLILQKNKAGDPQIVEAEQWAMAVEAELGQPWPTTPAVESLAAMRASHANLLAALERAVRWMDDRREVAEFVPEIADGTNAVIEARKIAAIQPPPQQS